MLSEKKRKQISTVAVSIFEIMLGRRSFSAVVVCILFFQS